MTDVPPAVPPPAALPPRAPRSLLVHFAVDTAVAFLAIVFLGLIFGLTLVVIAGFALLMGAALAPITRRAEARQLAERGAAADAAADPREPGPGPPGDGVRP